MFREKLEAVKAWLLRKRQGVAMTAWILAIATGLVMGVICYVIVDNVTNSVNLSGLGGTIIGYGKIFFALFVAFLPTIGLSILSRG